MNLKIISYDLFLPQTSIIDETLELKFSGCPGIQRQEFVIYKNDESIGRIVLTEDKHQKTLILHTIRIYEINPHNRRQGVGAQIINYLLDMAKNLNRGMLLINSTANYGLLHLLYSKIPGQKEFRLYPGSQIQKNWTPGDFLSGLNKIYATCEQDKNILFQKQTNGLWLAAEDENSEYLLKIKNREYLSLERKIDKRNTLLLPQAQFYHREFIFDVAIYTH